MSVHVFGIRHHGPGSARSLCQALKTLQPDIILVEGAPDAEAVLPLLVHPQMRPPVALLIYVPNNPQQAVYYPFAVFSPEWQAIRYGFQHQIPVRLMDLPQTHQLAIDPSSPPKPEADTDPLSLLAQAAGDRDGERWWERLVEQRQDSTAVFAAILEAMTVLRSEVQPLKAGSIEAQREAYMRKIIRETEQQGFQNIAVVCGAWHAPALVKMPSVKEDTALLKGLPKVKVEATWVPWTYGRLTMSSGYGAGVESPGWYQHLWKQSNPQQTSTPIEHSIRWMTQVARSLRAQDLDASSASVIEAVRLAETLAALRDRTLPGLAELNEATQTVLCFGDPLPMQLIRDRLIVGERLGKVPDDTPMVPLQQD
ncbi:MAG TPA: DUF5682 family protein, partial [Leptolyngbya sp.]|nr:DUF5682 family protein [Leptolyngbya sp.]